MGLAYLANIILIFLELLGLRKRPAGFEWRMFAFYTQLSNITALVSSVIYIITRGSAAAVYLRYLAACMLAMTVFVTLCILVPMGGGFRKLMLSGNGLYHHTLCPALSILSYVLWENHVRIWLLPALVTLAYGIIIMVLNALGKVDGPYPFFRVRHQSRTATVLWTAVLFGVISVLSALIAQA